MLGLAKKSFAFILLQISKIFALTLLQYCTSNLIKEAIHMIEVDKFSA